MKKNFSTILIVLVFLVGLGVLLYPTVSNWYNQQISSYAIASYQEAVADISDEEYENMFDEAKAFNSSLTSQIGTFVAGSSKDEHYKSLLSLTSGMMGYLIIDKIDVYLPVYHGTSSATLQKGIGHLEGSFLPTGELGNNTVLTGHTGLPTAELLTDLVELENGDTFKLEVLNKTFVYQVFDISVVEPSEVDKLQGAEGKDVVTLVTCTPYGVNSHRLLVQAQQIKVIDALKENAALQGKKEEGVRIWDILPPYTFPLLALLILTLIYTTILSIKQKRNKRKFDKLEIEYS